MSDWTLSDVSALDDQTIVVTGANSGLGYEATRMFADRGATVVMACRSTDRGNDAKEEILEELPDADLHVRKCDLADLDSIRAFAERLHEDVDAVDVLCNNAGVMAIPRRETADGFEMQFGVNHLGHFALTGHLIDVLIETPSYSRVVTQSSGLHERGDVDFSDLQHENEYDKWDAYAQSKLANLLFAFELDARLTHAGIENVVSLGCHPGYADTNLQRRGPEQAGSTLRLWLMKAANALLAQDAAQGALPMLYAATAPDVASGEYVGPNGFMSMRGAPAPATASREARDRDRARRLWTRSEELTGVSFGLKEEATPLE